MYICVYLHVIKLKKDKKKNENKKKVSKSFTQALCRASSPRPCFLKIIQQAEEKW